MRSARSSSPFFFLKALSLYFCCIETVVETSEETCLKEYWEIFNGLRQSHNLPTLGPLKRESASDFIAGLVQKHDYAQASGFGVTQVGQWQWTYAKIRCTENAKVEEQLLTQFRSMLQDTLDKNTTFSIDPTSTFLDFIEVKSGVNTHSVIILDEHLYSHNQLFGQDNSFSLGWDVSGSYVVTVLLSKITRVTVYEDSTEELRKILRRSLQNNLDPFVLQFQATSLAERIFRLHTEEHFKGLIEGPGFQASIQIESFTRNPKMTNDDDEVLAKMLGEIKANSKSNGGNPTFRKLGEMFPYVHDGFSSEDFQALSGSDHIAFGVYQNEKKRISVVLYFNTFTKTIRELRERFGGNEVFDRLKDGSKVKALKLIGNNIFRTYSSGFAIFDNIYAVSFLKFVKTEAYQFGMEKALMKSLLDSISIKDARKEINIKLKVLDHSFTLLFEGNSVADLAQIISTSTTEITPALIEIDEFYVAVLVTKISDTSLRNLPIFVLDVLQEEAGKALRKRMQQGLKFISGDFMDQTLRNPNDIKAELQIILENCEVQGIAIQQEIQQEMQQEIQSNKIHIRFVTAAVSMKSVEAHGAAVLGFPELYIDCSPKDASDSNFVTTIVAYTHPAWILFKDIKAEISGLDFSLSLRLTKWATNFARKHEHMETLATFGFTEDNHIVSTIHFNEEKSEDYYQYILKLEEVDFKIPNYKPYQSHTEAKDDYRVIYDRTTSADIFQIFTAREVGVAHIKREDKIIFIFAYAASSISLGCLLPLINSYRSPEKRTTFNDSEILKDVNEGYLQNCLPDLSRSPVGVPGLIIHQQTLITYQVLPDSVNFKSSLVEEIFRFGQTILSSNKTETDEKTYVPWTNVKYQSTVQTISKLYAFLVPNESLKIQKELILNGKLRGMHFREQENGLRSIQLFYNYNSKLDDHDDNVGIKLANKNGVIDIKEYIGFENTQQRNRIGGSIARSLATKQLRTSTGYIVLEDCIVAFAKFTPANTSNRVELASLIVNSLMKSNQQFSVVEASTAKDSIAFDYKYTIITGSSKTFERLVDSAQGDVGFAYTSVSDCMIGALVFKLSLPMANLIHKEGHKWESLYSMNFLANEIASSWAEKDIPSNFAHGNITAQDQELFSVAVLCKTVTVQPEVSGEIGSMIKAWEEGTEDKIKINSPGGLTGEFKAGGPPTFIPKLKDALNVGVGWTMKKIGGEKFQFYLVILIPAN